MKIAVIDDYQDSFRNHPLLKMDNATCTPHLGYVEKATYESYFGGAIDNILAYAAGKPANVLNPEALKQ